ncbi:hypothetical protein Poli38472_000072 [Pythium oligandrum]|uniref:NADH:flavin oxidoreductase/NADH oxidase N-terminal domain-containing protein n=1 Tax=Pythium oligandrum TaxID=41045 RepID=A0A8K1FE14_PYTOL|nr:hypothetical protein Poli38472_000072 [Pythium oligandrum]|eukprot:TMW60030.1 hypothetical protein Poli38472_000072 [Pythium oligandrum]
MVATPPKLFTPVRLGGRTHALTLQHRVAMPPLSRLRTGDAGVQPDFGVKYYEQRATRGGLIIAEATNISATARGFYGAPGIFTQEQIDAWKPITQAVHDKGGVIFLQLWHTGRISHPSLQPNGELPVSASSTLPLDGTRATITKDGPQPLVRPRALETHEIPGICEDYRQAAVNAIAAGFDGVELHASTGQLPEQFLFDGMNDRTDKYGGSVENRARFLFEALEAILQSLESSQVGVRLSPYSKSCKQQDSDPAATTRYVFTKLNDYDLAYAHVVEPRDFHYESELTPPQGATAFIRSLYKGVLITASGYDRESAMEAVEKGIADIVAIGRYFISNPDLVRRFQLNAKLTPFDRATFYTPGEAGYTDYPCLDEPHAVLMEHTTP